jgi:NTE family protein
VDALYGLGRFERVSYDILTADGRTGLLVTAKENPAQRQFFRFGVLLESDFASRSNFNIAGSYTIRDLNRWGGEWRTYLRVGSDLGIGTEFYQPFGDAMNVFVAPSISALRTDSLFFASGDTPVAEIRLNALETGLDAGTLLGRWGELRVGARRLWGDIKPTLAVAAFPAFAVDDAYYFVRFDVDTLDRLSFPSRGMFARVQFNDHADALSGDFSFNELEMRGTVASSWGANTLRFSGKFQTITNAGRGGGGGFQLGGFLNLSGLAPGQLSGRHVVYANTIYARRLTNRTPFFDTPIYAGGSLEIGNVFGQLREVQLEALTTSGSLFVGIDSPLGPLFLGGGLTDRGDTAVYLYLGQTF